MPKSFGGLFEFSIFAVSPEGKIRELTEEEEYEYCYDEELGDAIYNHVDKFLEEDVDVAEYDFQVETYENNGGPLIDYCITMKSDGYDQSPMYAFSLEGISIPHREKEGWRIAVSAGGVRKEDEDEEEEDEADDSSKIPDFSHEALMAAKEKFELYPPFVTFLEQFPRVKAHVDSVTGKTVGVGAYGCAFLVVTDDDVSFGISGCGRWDAGLRTVVDRA
jgi:hypothetical protein